MEDGPANAVEGPLCKAPRGAGRRGRRLPPVLPNVPHGEARASAVHCADHPGSSTAVLQVHGVLVPRELSAAEPLGEDRVPEVSLVHDKVGEELLCARRTSVVGRLCLWCCRRRRIRPRTSDEARDLYDWVMLWCGRHGAHVVHHADRLYAVRFLEGAHLHEAASVDAKPDSVLRNLVEERLRSFHDRAWVGLRVLQPAPHCRVATCRDARTPCEADGKHLLP
mmetsp:Transcript_72149/g.211400  ORF Transcript_72149/g.211400 Transcript_72149/m.211400 type:complete len:223 (+) Transcript_72149:139-807(+)